MQKLYKSYIFFDFECYADENGKHIPNLIKAQRVCLNCIDTNERCCNMNTFYDNDSFCKWLFKQDYYIAIAHNYIVM